MLFPGEWVPHLKAWPLLRIRCSLIPEFLKNHVSLFGCF